MSCSLLRQRVCLHSSSSWIVVLRRSSRAAISIARFSTDPAPPEPRAGVQQRRHRPIYVAATRQHVGKTSVSLAMLSGLRHHVGNKVGFMKPVGQQCVEVEEPNDTYQTNVEMSDVDKSRIRRGNSSDTSGVASKTSSGSSDLDNNNTILVQVDKDAAVFQQHFGLQQRYLDTSPVVIPPGYTKDYVDGKILGQDQKSRIQAAYQNIARNSDIVLCEGTGHVAVGSIIEASNAQVASWLGASMVLVANGGLGHSFDELELNRIYCERYGVDIAGVVINKVVPEKYEQTKYYLEKILNDRWGVPLLGCLRDRPFLGCPALSDFERILTGSSLVSGHDFKLRHFKLTDIDLITTSLNVFLKQIRHKKTRTLYLCHSSRNDILLGFLMEYWQRGPGWEAAMIVTGCEEHPISTQVLEIITGALSQAPPVLLALQPTKVVMERLNNYTPKLNIKDKQRVEQTIAHYEPGIDFGLLLERAGYEDVGGGAGAQAV